MIPASLLLALVATGHAADPAVEDVAVPPVDAQLFQPAVDASGTMWVDDATVAKAWTFTGRAYWNYVQSPLVWVYEDGTTYDVVKSASNLDVMAALSFGRLRLGVDVPLFLSATTDLPDVSGGVGLGDLALDAKLGLLGNPSTKSHAALTGRVWAPTATEALSLGEDGLAGEVALAVDGHAGPVLLAANVGTHFVPNQALDNVTAGDQLLLRGAIGLAFTTHAGIAVENAGALSLANPFDNVAANPFESVLTGYGRIGQVVVRGGVGHGWTEGLGSPAYRVLLGVGYEPRDPDDTDGDGIVDKEDACKKVPEDKDGFEDTDGCPEDDNDRDGLVDSVDRCPLDPEDKDGFEDEDGCPDLDNDKDGVADASDACPNDPEDKDGYRDEDGCPDMAYALTARVVDPDGNPIPSAMVTLSGAGAAEPNPPTKVHPGSYVAMAEAPGYVPDSAQFVMPSGTYQLTVTLKPVPRVVVNIVKKTIDLNEQVLYETDKAVIRPESYPLLDAIVATMREHPEITYILVEGHTDERGSDSHNLSLSKQRAASVVRYLTEHGVAASRMHSQGYGETRPIDPAHNDAAWEKNRRVEIHIEKMTPAE